MLMLFVPHELVPCVKERTERPQELSDIVGQGRGLIHQPEETPHVCQVLRRWEPRQCCRRPWVQSIAVGPVDSRTPA